MKQENNIFKMYLSHFLNFIWQKEMYRLPVPIKKGKHNKIVEELRFLSHLPQFEHLNDFNRSIIDTTARVKIIYCFDGRKFGGREISINLVGIKC